jgi:transposase-like protein
VTLTGVVERDETYVVAGHKGQPEKVAEAGRPPRRRRLKGARGRGAKATEKPPIFGMAQRSGEAVIRMLDNVQQATIKPLILQTVAAGALVNADEHSIYGRLREWGYRHKAVNRSQGERARDEDGDGFHEVRVNTMEGLWSLLRSWLRPRRGISQDKPPLRLGFFEFVHNLKRRGKRLLSSLLAILLKKTPKSI